MGEQIITTPSGWAVVIGHDGIRPASGNEAGGPRRCLDEAVFGQAIDYITRIHQAETED